MVRKLLLGELLPGKGQSVLETAKLPRRPTSSHGRCPCWVTYAELGVLRLVLQRLAEARHRCREVPTAHRKGVRERRSAVFSTPIIPCYNRLALKICLFYLHARPAERRERLLRRAVRRLVVGRGRVLLLTKNTWRSKPFRDIGHLLTKIAQGWPNSSAPTQRPCRGA
jgi:hypothetical protein